MSVQVTQTVVEVLVPFTEGTTTVQGIETARFDAGTGNSYYLVAPVVDSGNELRSKVTKYPRVTSRRTNQAIKMYTYDVETPVTVSDLENGTNSITGALLLANTTEVAQSALQPANCPNAVLSTIRVEGNDTGQPVRDQIHEVVYQVAIQGVRR